MHEYAVASRRVRLSRLRGNARMHVGVDLDNNLSSHSLQSQAGVREVGHRKSGDPAALCHGRDLSTGVMIPFFSASLAIVAFRCFFPFIFTTTAWFLSPDSGCDLLACDPLQVPA